MKKIGTKCMMYKLYSRLFPNDQLVLSACARIGAYNYLKRYDYILKEWKKEETNEKIEKKKIWVCWLQGYEQAPPIVKQCIKSIKQHSFEIEVVLLDNNSLSQYITIPSYIEEKNKRGIIPNAHYADYIRLMILSKFGGIWIDSTTFLTNKLPEYVISSDLFCFKCQPIGKVLASNWLISSIANHPIINQVLMLLDEYWKKENRLVSYSIFHLFWTMVVEYNNDNKHLWYRVPYFDDVNCKILQQELFTDFSDKRYEEIKNISSIHKLTYKFPASMQEKESTFYNKIINL